MPASGLRPGLFCSALALLVLHTLGNARIAVGADASTLQPILTAISDPSFPNMKEADRVWNGGAAIGANVLAKYAMALAYARNNRHQAAFDLIDQIPLEARQAGPLRRFHIWLLIRLKKDNLAEEAIDGFLGELPKRTGKPPSQVDQEDVEFLARLLTYLERIDDRPDRLTRQQAQAWFTALEALPTTWRGDVAAHQAAVLADYAERQRKVEATYDSWRTKTSSELAETQERVAKLAEQEKTIRDQLASNTKAHEDFVMQFGSTIKAIEAKAGPLIQARNALVKPFPPTKLSTIGKSEQVRNAMDQEYKDATKKYQQDLQLYQSRMKFLNDQIGPLERQAAPLYAQEKSFRAKIAETQAELAKVERPISVQIKNEQRLAKLLADSPTWETPSYLSQLRALDAAAIIAFPAEVERITRVLNK